MALNLKILEPNENEVHNRRIKNLKKGLYLFAIICWTITAYKNYDVKSVVDVILYTICLIVLGMFCFLFSLEE
jgi:hypothetical protein